MPPSLPLKKLLPILACLVIFELAFSPFIAALAQEVPSAVLETGTETSVVNEPLVEEAQSYPLLMRRARELEKGRDEYGSELDPEQIAAKKVELAASLEQFIKTENDALKTLGVDSSKRKAYFKLLKTQLKKFDDTESIWERIAHFFADAFNFGEDKTEESYLQKNQEEYEEEIKIPKYPGSFQFNEQKPEIKRIEKLNAKPEEKDKLKGVLKDLITIEVAEAVEDSYLPVIEDLQEDGSEIIINAEIEDLAHSLNDNPVFIFNFVQSTIQYEPYFGAKKGALGCLHDKICNDTDAASLTIALMRAAGIPARYKKSFAVIPVGQLQNLLGVDETKTVYAALALNKVPVYTISGQSPDGDFDSYDFSSETHLALEWVYPEIFYEYDERGANFGNLFPYQTAADTASLRALIGQNTNKQWVPIDPIVQPYTRTKAEIVHDTANFNTENFWSSFLQYQGELSPYDKYIADLQTATGKRITEEQYQSTNVSAGKAFHFLPPALPYATASGTVDGKQIPEETWSQLPDTHRPKVTISLLKESNRSAIIQETYYASEINNIETNLFYEGKSPTDKQVIDAYGGIYATPAALVEIVPVLEVEAAKTTGAIPVRIGDQLILHFEYETNGTVTAKDEKFSTAGNNEGIYISLSGVKDDGTAPTNSEILAQGNHAIAREFLKKTQSHNDTISRALDFGYNTLFSRAVVTQNRILTEVNNIPTTFDFKGLTIDASEHLNGYSRRGDYKIHSKDFFLLAGLNGSYYESQIFTDISGLSGISTVKGLQYAYANPSNYTVHTITSANESVIDTLSLSANTKQNLHKEVQKGNIVITPDRLVEDGTWRGIFYISAEPNGAGTYAIGEQTQLNGGWTTSDLLQYLYIDETAESRYGYLRQLNAERFYAEDIYSDTVLCRITDVEYAAIISRPDWSTKYGMPCSIGGLKFGSINHAYIHASNAAHFYSPEKYDYWAYASQITDKIKTYIQQKKNLPSTDLNYLEDGTQYTFKFSTILGTYIQSICETSPTLTLFGANKCGNYGTLYYSPTPTGGAVYRAKGAILDKLGKDNNAVITKIGFPLGDAKHAISGVANSKISQGQYQDFINGQVFAYELQLPIFVSASVSVYTYGTLTNAHTEQGGAISSLGFPVSDPKVSIDGALVYQKFENGQEMEITLETNNVQLVNFKKYRCELYGNIQHNSALLQLIQLEGFFDTAEAELTGSIDFVETILLHPVKAYGNISQFIQELRRMNSKQIIDGLGGAVSALVTSALEEYSDAVNTNACPARIWYTQGKVGGAVATFVIPTERITALVKLKILNRLKLVFPGLKQFAKIGSFGSKFKFLRQADIDEWNRIKAITDSNLKGSAGEAFWEGFVKNGKKASFNTHIGTRNIDVYDPLTTKAYEVKNYSNKVPLNTQIQSEIDKDVYLRNTEKQFHPVWVFTDQGPASSLEKILKDNAIDYIILTD